MSFLGIGFVQWLIILFILFLLFGGKKMTELARGLGQSSKELKKAKKEFESIIENEPIAEEKKKK